MSPLTPRFMSIVAPEILTERDVSSRFQIIQQRSEFAICVNTDATESIVIAWLIDQKAPSQSSWLAMQLADDLAEQAPSLLLGRDFCPRYDFVDVIWSNSGGHAYWSDGLDNEPCDGDGASLVMLGDLATSKPEMTYRLPFDISNIGPPTEPRYVSSGQRASIAGSGVIEARY